MDEIVLEQLSVEDAASRLGLTPSAVLKRLQKGKMQGYKTDGKWFVSLPKNGNGKKHLEPEKASTAIYDKLVDALQAENTFLKEELAKRNSEIERRDTIIMSLTQRVPLLSAPAPQVEKKKGLRLWLDSKLGLT